MVFFKSLANVHFQVEYYYTSLFGNVWDVKVFNIISLFKDSKFYLLYLKYYCTTVCIFYPFLLFVFFVHNSAVNYL